MEVHDGQRAVEPELHGSREQLDRQAARHDTRLDMHGSHLLRRLFRNECDPAPGIRRSGGQFILTRSPCAGNHIPLESNRQKRIR